MSKTGRNILSVITGAVFIIVLIALGIYNCKNNDKFFDASFTTLVTIAIAVIVSYFLVQKKTDKRRKNEKIDDLLYKIQCYVNEDNFVLTGEDISRKNLILHRTISNKIRCLKSLGLDKNSKKELEYIEKNFKDFRRVYGDNYSSREKMEEKYSELKNYVVRIDDACDKIHMTLM